MKKKIFTLLTLALLSVSSVWALESGTESSGNQGSNNTSIVGKSYTLDGKFIAGKGGVQQGNMPDKGVKLRSNQGNLVFEVNEGYKITSFKFYGCGNTTTAVDVESATVDGGSNLLSATVTLPGKGESTSGDIALTSIEATDNITLTFASGSSAQIVGTWEIAYEQTSVVVQEITGVKLNGTAIGEDDLATLKSTKGVTIDGASLNGAGAVEVTLSSGSTTVTKSFSGTSAIYKFTINSNDEYTVTVTNIGKTYSAQGTIVYYSKNDTNAEGANSAVVVANGVTLTYSTKTFQYGTGKVTIGSDAYVPLKLSTGEAFTATLPEGKVATKLIVYGWSQNGNGAMPTIKEASESTDKVISSAGSDIFYATNTEGDICPSVYEYDLDSWESFYFSAGGSASQPFIVLDIVLEDAPDAPVERTADFKFTAKSDWTNATQTVKEVTATFAQGSESAPSISVQAEYVSFKKENTLTIAANDGYVITGISVAYVSGYTPNSNTVEASTGGMSADGTSWTGAAKTVVLTKSAGSNDSRVNALSVTYVPAKNVTLASSGTSSFSSSKDLDFSAVDGLKAYAVTNITLAAVTLTSVNAAPASTGLVLKGTASTDYNIPVAATTPAAISDNKLVAAVERTQVDANSAWVLNDGAFKLYTGEYIPAGKAYLPATEVPAAAARLQMVFDGEATGISTAVNDVLGDGRFFDLQGRQVAQPTKGMYIVNGKKVLVK